MNAIDWIELPSEPHHTLDWSCEIDRAKKSVATGKKIFWKFALGLEQPLFPLEEELRFQSLSLALQQFSRDIWPFFQEATFGLCLYKGVADIHFSWTEKQEENCSAWIGEEDLPEGVETRRLFCLEAFAVYFQMLSHRLPDEAPIFLLFDLTGFRSPSAALSALGKERFEYFTLGTRGLEIPREGFRFEGNSIQFHSIESSVGLVFPEYREAFADFDDLLAKIENPVKVVFETFLSEEWEGLDRLFVLSKKISPQGERMLKGFVAAGGEVVLI